MDLKNKSAYGKLLEMIKLAPAEMQQELRSALDSIVTDPDERHAHIWLTPNLELCFNKHKPKGGSYGPFNTAAEAVDERFTIMSCAHG